MWSVKYRPKPGSASTSARSAAGRPATSSTTSGTPSVNIREEVRLSASVSVMAPTCECACSSVPATAGTRRHTIPAARDGRDPTAVPASGSGLVRPIHVRARGLQHLVGPQVMGVRGRGGEGVPSPVVRPVEVLPRLPRLVGLLAAPPRVDEVLVG